MPARDDEQRIVASLEMEGDDDVHGALGALHLLALLSMCLCNTVVGT